MRADRRVYGRASALPLDVLLAAKVSPPRSMLAEKVRRLLSQPSSYFLTE